ncbi:MAG: PhnD/SsuA/transferrin family substrate-binding protein [Rhodobacteraceae bacterium]|nr:PhnD/SsuA/transferrin family substrate-binding protein [Paracoccaceae bacterium]
MIAAGLAALVVPLRARSEPTTLTFGLTPVFLSDDQELLRLIREYLQATTGAPVRLVQRRTYQEITAMLLAGQIDAAWICGYPFVRHRDALALVAVPVWRGRPLYQSYLIARSRRGARRLADLRGDIHAFSDPDSNSGYLVTQAALASLETAPNAFFARSFFTYGHRNVVRAVASGLAQSGSVDGYVWEALASTEPALAGATEIVARSDWLGFPPVVCLAGRADAPGIRALAAALATMDADSAGREVLALLQLDGFRAADPQLFDGIAALVHAVGQAG